MLLVLATSQKHSDVTGLGMIFLMTLGGLSAYYGCNLVLCLTPLL
jgi:hypothetical protein